MVLVCRTVIKTQLKMELGKKFIKRRAIHVNVIVKSVAAIFIIKPLSCQI